MKCKIKYKMINLDNIVSNKNMSSSEDNNWPFRMLIIGPSGSGKTLYSKRQCSNRCNTYYR